MEEFIFHRIIRNIEIKSVVTAFDVIRPKNFDFPGEMHDFWEAVCVASGSAIATADDRIYKMTRGDLIFHKPMEFHRVRSADNTAPRLLIISFEACGNALKQLENGFFRLNDYRIQELAQICGICDKFISGGFSEEEYEWLSTEAAIGLEGFLNSLCAGEPRAVPNEPRYAGEYRRIINYMEAHCRERLTVGKIARECGMSASNLKRVFGMFCDRGIIEYHNSLRIRLAIKMLDGNTAVSRISDELGFSSPAYFDVAFRRETGLSPKEYCKRRENIG